MDRVKATVQAVMANSARARDDDRWLLFDVLKARGFPVTAELEATVESWPMPESVRRARTRIQNEEQRLLPSQEVRERRSRPRRPGRRPQ